MFQTKFVETITIHNSIFDNFLPKIVPFME